MIGDRLLMTAGHMVPWGDNPWWIRFVPAYYDGTSLHGAGVESYVSDARGYDVQGNLTGYDWAVCRLYNPLGSWLEYFGYNGYADSWDDQPYWSIIGYPGAIANAMRPSFQGGITVDDTDGDSNGGEELESENADITGGDSGGPMFGWWGNDPRLVGVVSGEEEMSIHGADERRLVNGERPAIRQLAEPVSASIPSATGTPIRSHHRRSSWRARARRRSSRS